MKRLILHIGHSKCASSTLQGYLSHRPVLPLAGAGGGVLRYATVGDDGRTRHGEGIVLGLAGNAYGYLNSAVDVLRDRVQFNRAMAEIADFSGPEDTVVLSCEAWGDARFFTPDVAAVLDSVPVPVDLFMLTRPPVEWINAAWWEWGIWMGVTLPEALARFQQINFLRALAPWRGIGCVARVAVRDLSQGPLDSFRAFAGVADTAPEWDRRLNTASDFDMLRHLVRNKERHARTPFNGQAEFRLNALIGGDRGPLPFVVPRAMARAVLARDQADNAELIALMQQDGPAIDPARQRLYCDPAAYDHLPETVDISASLVADYSDAFVGKLVDTILDLGRDLSVRNDFFTAYQGFDPLRYLDLNPDVRDAGMNPYEHFLRFGFQEGRRVL